MNGKTFTGYYDKRGKRIFNGDIVKWGTIGKFYVFSAPHTKSAWGMVRIDKLSTWDKHTADYFLPVFDDNKDKILSSLEKLEGEPSMTLEQLTEIIRTADQKAIDKALRKLGYTYCNKDKTLCKVGIVELVNAVKYETDDIADSQRKHLYNGRICGTVKGYENHEFVFVNVYDIKPSTDPFDDEETAIQTAMHIYAKGIER